MSTLHFHHVRESGVRGGRRRPTMKAIFGLAQTEASFENAADYGFDPCTVSLLELSQIVELAWADGSISPRDRRLLTAAAASRPGIRGRACVQLSNWLARRPPAAMFRLCRRALGEFLQHTDICQATRIRSALREDCGLVLWGGDRLLQEKIVASAEQQRLLSALARDLRLDTNGSGNGG